MDTIRELSNKIEKAEQNIETFKRKRFVIEDIKNEVNKFDYNVYKNTLNLYKRKRLDLWDEQKPIKIIRKSSELLEEVLQLKGKIDNSKKEIKEIYNSVQFCFENNDDDISVLYPDDEFCFLRNRYYKISNEKGFADLTNSVNKKMNELEKSKNNDIIAYIDNLIEMKNYLKTLKPKK